MTLAWLCLAVALALLGTSGRPRRAEPPATAPALALDLLAVALRAGQPTGQALTLAADVADGPSAAALARVGRLLQLGADPPQAWAAIGDDAELAQVAAAGVRSASSGVRAAAEFERVAAALRAQRATAAQGRAARAGVLVAAPLGLCFLPAFVCLGIVPTVIGIAGAVLHG